MENKQDSYWTECSLDETVDRKVCEYLRGHHAEYRNAKKRIKELMDQYPNVQAVFETEDAVTLTAEEHEILHTYFELEDRVEMIEREYHFYMGQSMMFSYGNMLAKLKKEIMNPEEGVTGHLLDFFIKTRSDELENELIEQNQQYREAIDEIRKYEEEMQKLNLPKAVRIQIDRYVSAVNWRWVLYLDYLYRSGMKDILLLIEKRNEGYQGWD